MHGVLAWQRRTCRTDSGPLRSKPEPACSGGVQRSRQQPAVRLQVHATSEPQMHKAGIEAELQATTPRPPHQNGTSHAPTRNRKRTEQAAAGHGAQREEHAAHALPAAQPAGGHPPLVRRGCCTGRCLCRGRVDGERRWRCRPLCRRRRLLLRQARGHALPGAAACGPGVAGGRQQPQRHARRCWPQALPPSQPPAAAGCWRHDGRCHRHAACREAAGRSVRGRVSLWWLVDCARLQRCRVISGKLCVEMHERGWLLRRPKPAA